MDDLVDQNNKDLQRGIATLKSFLGQGDVQTLLQKVATRKDELASYSLRLPPDYTGAERQLQIGFPKDFPRSGLTLTVEPSPWLVWPHAMEDGFCLHGFQQRPVTGSPEFVVSDSLARFREIARFALKDSCPVKRIAEFQREIRTYWSLQLSRSHHNLILLDWPKTTTRLHALDAPGQALPSSKRTIWFAEKPSSIANYYKCRYGSSRQVRAPETPGFYVKLQSYPDIHFPRAEDLLPWLEPHLAPDDKTQLFTWFNELGSLPERWIVIELPGDPDAPIFCLNVRRYDSELKGKQSFNLRTARRHPAIASSIPPRSIQVSTLNILDRREIFSRDHSGTPQILEKAHVVCVGAGSLGSNVALQLARSGVGKLTLIDPDKFESANLGRHVLGAESLGLTKVQALQELIRKDLVFAEVAALTCFVESAIRQNPDVFENADLVVITTADWQSEVLLWEEKSKGTSWGLLQAWSEPHTQVGHALLAPAGGFDARGLFTERGDFNYKFTEWPENGVIDLPACGESFIPGGSLGIMRIALMITQAALDMLSGNISHPRWLSTINKPQDLQKQGGTYSGPELPKGIQQAQFEQDWPKPAEE